MKHHSFQCYDMMMTLAPATLLTLLTIVVNLIFGFAGVILGHTSWTVMMLEAVGGNLFGIYMSLFFFGLITTITEWKRIHCHAGKKILYLFTFPIFIFTYIPIAVVAIFKKVTWVPIPHTIAKNVQEIRS